MILTLIIFVLGLIIGGLAFSLIVVKSLDGTIVVDHSIPEDQPNIFLELNDGTILDNNCSVLIRVEHRNYIPHE